MLRGHLRWLGGCEERGVAYRTPSYPSRGWTLCGIERRRRLLVAALLKFHAVEPAHLRQPIENRPPHSMPGKRGELQPTVFVKPLQGLKQTYLAVGDQIVEFHHMRHSPMDFPGDRPHKTLVEQKRPVQISPIQLGMGAYRSGTVLASHQKPPSGPSTPTAYHNLSERTCTRNKRVRGGGDTTFGLAPSSRQGRAVAPGERSTSQLPGARSCSCCCRRKPCLSSLRVMRLRRSIRVATARPSDRQQPLPTAAIARA